MAERLILSGFPAFAGSGLPCGFRETITMTAMARRVWRTRRAAALLASRRTGRRRAWLRLTTAERSADAPRAHGPRAPWTIRSTMGLGKSKVPGNKGAGLWERGRRRTRQDQISRWAGRPGEIAELKEIRTERRKPVSSAGPVSDRAPELFERSIQPFDLMSRRHPLSSTRAAYLKPASRSRPSWRLV